MKKLYDPAKRRLIFLGKQATPDYWDAQWRTGDFRKSIIGESNRLYIDYTKRYIPKTDSLILEGGCGRGGKVYSLMQAGYKVIGVDSARETVRMANSTMPELDIRYGDVRKFGFSEEKFDGYWSLGVIEHFWEGYGEVLREAARVLKRHGHLFISFPYMSPLRKLKASLGAYGTYSEKRGIDGEFYQFALPMASVAAELEHWGFKILDSKPKSAPLGLRQELPPISPFIDWLESRPETLISRAGYWCIKRLMSGVAGHSCLLVSVKE